jgi:hypothetical protein
MPATISSAGTWTPLNVDFSRMSKLGPNTLHADMMQLEQLKNQDLPEFNQFIQLVADGYGIGFNPALALVSAIFTARMNRENPSVSRSYAA